MHWGSEFVSVGPGYEHGQLLQAPVLVSQKEPWESDSHISSSPARSSRFSVK